MNNALSVTMSMIQTTMNRGRYRKTKATIWRRKTKAMMRVKMGRMEKAAINSTRGSPSASSV